MTLENISIDYIWSQRASASLRGRLLESTRGSRSSVPELTGVSRIIVRFARLSYFLE